MKATVKSLQKEIEQLEEKLSKIPDIKACVECKSVKLRSEFIHISCYMSYCSPPTERDYCKPCAARVEEREIAVNIAKKAPKKVVNWWGSGK